MKIFKKDNKFYFTPDGYNRNGTETEITGKEYSVLSNILGRLKKQYSYDYNKRSWFESFCKLEQPNCEECPYYNLCYDSYVFYCLESDEVCWKDEINRMIDIESHYQELLKFNIMEDICRYSEGEV